VVALHLGHYFKHNTGEKITFCTLFGTLPTLETKTLTSTQDKMEHLNTIPKVMHKVMPEVISKVLSSSQSDARSDVFFQCDAQSDA
jgi:hypothetical protein